MSNASLIAALDSARADEVLERARNVIAKQDEIVAALREALSGCVDAMADGGNRRIAKWAEAELAGRKALALPDDTTR